LGLKTQYINNNPVHAINKDINGAEEFWDGVHSDHDFFIDACTAFSLTGGRYGVSSEEYDTPGHWIQGNTFPLTDRNIGAIDVDIDDPADEFPSSFNQGKGHPSRGIWGPNNTYMDISFSGMSGGITESGDWDDQNVPLRLQDVPSSNVNQSNANEFISRLTTSGTTFRFRNDPDEVVYTVQQTSHNPAPYTSYLLARLFCSHPSLSLPFSASICLLTSYFAHITFHSSIIPPAWVLSCTEKRRPVTLYFQLVLNSPDTIQNTPL